MMIMTKSTKLLTIQVGILNSAVLSLSDCCSGCSPDHDCDHHDDDYGNNDDNQLIIKVIMAIMVMIMAILVMITMNNNKNTLDAHRSSQPGGAHQGGSNPQL